MLIKIGDKYAEIIQQQNNWKNAKTEKKYPQNKISEFLSCDFFFFFFWPGHISVKYDLRFHWVWFEKQVLSYFLCHFCSSLSVSPAFLFYIVCSRQMLRGQVIENSSCCLGHLSFSRWGLIWVPMPSNAAEYTPTSHELFYGFLKPYNGDGSANRICVERSWKSEAFICS